MELNPTSYFVKLHVENSADTRAHAASSLICPLKVVRSELHPIYNSRMYAKNVTPQESGRMPL